MVPKTPNVVSAIVPIILLRLLHPHRLHLLPTVLIAAHVDATVWVVGQEHRATVNALRAAATVIAMAVMAVVEAAAVILHFPYYRALNFPNYLNFLKLNILK